MPLCLRVLVVALCRARLRGRTLASSLGIHSKSTLYSMLRSVIAAVARTAVTRPGISLTTLVTLLIQGVVAQRNPAPNGQRLRRTTFTMSEHQPRKLSPADIATSVKRQIVRRSCYFSAIGGATVALRGAIHSVHNWKVEHGSCLGVRHHWKPTISSKEVYCTGGCRRWHCTGPTLRPRHRRTGSCAQERFVITTALEHRRCVPPGLAQSPPQSVGARADAALFDDLRRRNLQMASLWLSSSQVLVLAFHGSWPRRLRFRHLLSASCLQTGPYNISR
ncbi:hypothetical protein FKP32DRAFT_1078223 [Trametes sanguinea]|nr:hypothetical protein FKP32DRAFT_1078223 [Trametes sanguinea]